MEVHRRPEEEAGYAVVAELGVTAEVVNKQWLAGLEGEAPPSA